MILSKRTLGLFTLVLGLVLVAGLVANAEMNKGCAGKAAASAKAAGCPAAQMGACSGKTVAGCAGKDMKAGNAGMNKTGCCAGMGEKAAAEPVDAGAMFPKGTKVATVDVPGGRDLVFTGPDLAAVETVLKDHVATCGASGTCANGQAGNTCAVTRNDKTVVLSVRGPNPEQCCLGMAVTGSASGKDGQAGCTPACPHAKAGAAAQTCPHAKGKKI
jgi:hypothetical protein